MDFLHMQTLPPTRDASSKRLLTQSAANGVGTPATAIHRTPVQVPSSDALFDQTPFGFGNLQYISDMMQFSGLDPMSAPPMPQSQLFCDPSNDAMQMDLDVPLGVDPFCPTPLHMEQSTNWEAFHLQETNSMQMPAFQSFQPSPVPSSFSNTHAAHGQNSRHNSFVTTFTSVGPDMTTSSGALLQQPGINPDSRQPYEIQLRDTQAKRERVRRARSQHSRSHANSSSGSAENAKPGLNRRNTYSMVEKVHSLVTEPRVAVPANLSTIPRRSSPLKRQSGGSMELIPEIRKPRIRLIIDMTGRARTETVAAEDDDVVEERQQRIRKLT
ncbi:PHD finger domain [Pyrenophora seminiperda CCB06]|uniref:PHD finger domain n=1 Tax=Pyrenophora seminiperda CCB06 TaxID=1302712 RepID=A0A3M7LVP8_9PLEO|nr:PHD finger domain [Pyrenophora seminiperda CCB06]